MKYQKKRKDRYVDAIQLNSLRDAQEIIDKVPGVLGAKDIWVNEDYDDLSTCYVRFYDLHGDLQVFYGEYVVWTDKWVKKMTAEEFERKYEPKGGYLSNNITISSTSTSPGIISGYYGTG